jgi:hypothetical protein
MPFGLTNAPPTFQRLMDEVTSGIEWTLGEVYMDDVITGLHTFEQHLEDLQKIFDRMRQHGLTMKLSKCQFFRKKLTFLGHDLTAIGIRANSTKIEAIQKIQPPTSLQELRTFLGVSGYYRRFIENYAKIAQPLTVLLRKNNLFKWDDKCQVAFEELKHRLVTAPILAFPDYKRPFKMETDASGYTLRCVLTQQGQDGLDHPIAYVSRTMTLAEKNYHTTEQECLAVVWGCQQFRPYIHGQRVDIYTDLKHYNG